MAKRDTDSVLMDGSVAFLMDAKATVKFMGPKAVQTIPGAPNGQPVDPSIINTVGEHTLGVVVVKAYGSLRQIAYAMWGPNNYFPTDILEEANKSGILKAGLSTRRDAHYGAGPMYYNLEATADMEVVKPVPAKKVPAKVLAFHRTAQLERCLKSIILDWEWWGWFATEYILDKSATTITSMRPLRASWVRWSLTNENGRIEWCLYNPNWPLFNSGSAEIIPVADPWWTPDQCRAWARQNGYEKFIRPSIMPDPNAGYYPDKDWHSLYKNKWLQNTNGIPASRDALLTNSINLKYHIEIPSSYFQLKYKDSWGTMTDAERDAKRKDMLVKMNEWLSGKENAGKAFVSEFAVDEDGKALPGWKITSLDNKMGDVSGSSIADSEKGNSEILATLRVDPTLLGQGAPGGKLGAGSGSDKAEAIRILHALMYSDREYTTDPWYFVRDYNGWPQDLYMGYRPMELSPQTTAKERPTANAS